LNISHQPAPPNSAPFYDKAIKKTPQQLITALPVVLVFRIPEERAQLRAADLEIRKPQNFNYISIFQLKGDPQFFQNIVVGHSYPRARGS
jgi:hypothetical protein